jgi:hypothetical protein
MNPRNPRLRALAALLVATFAAACDSDDVAPTDPVPEALAGSWEASPDCPACEFSVTLTSTGQVISLLEPPISASIEIDIATGGGFVMRAELYGQKFTSAGTARTDGPTVYITLPTGAVDTATYSLSGSTLTLEYKNEIRSIDFDGQPGADPGRVKAVLRRMTPSLNRQ